MLNYVMAYLLAYLLSSQSLLQAPGVTEPDHAGRSRPTRTCRCSPGPTCGSTSGFLIAIACAFGVVVAAEPDHHRVRVPQSVGANAVGRAGGRA